MSVILKVTTGTINYTDWLHVTAAKVASPGTIVWEDWIDVPITNYNFDIPGLDPENYIVSFYDAPTNTALGALRLQLLANALTNEYIYERRFYKCGRGGVGEPSPGDTKITDPYFFGKTITGAFKTGYGYLEPSTEWEMQTVTSTDDTVALLTGVPFDIDEMFIVEIKLSAGTIASTGGSFYTGRVDVSAGAYTCLVSDKNKRHRLVGSGPTQVVTLPALASLSQDNTYLFDNSCGGVARQVKILFNGADVLSYNGMNAASLNFSEFWVAKGETLMIGKVDNNWEVLVDYKGTNVGEHFMGTFKDHPNTIIEDGQIGAAALDGDELPRLWWWIQNMLPNTHYIVDDTVVNTSYVHPAGKEGLFVVHSTLKKFRTGNWQGMVDKGLKDMDNYGAGTDPERAYNYPGGKENQAMMNHRHYAIAPYDATSSGFPANSSVGYQNQTGGAGDFKYTIAGKVQEPTNGRTGKPIDETGASNGNDKNKVDNIGCVALRRI